MWILQKSLAIGRLSPCGALDPLFSPFLPMLTSLENITDCPSWLLKPKKPRSCVMDKLARLSGLWHGLM